MAAISSIDSLVNLLTGGGAAAPQPIWVMKSPRVSSSAAVAPVAGQWTSLWQYAGVPGVGGTNPSTVATCTKATSGAVPFTNPTGGRQLWMQSFGVTLNTQGGVLLYDRLLQIGGLSGTTTTAQNVQSGSGVSLSRYTSGQGNQIGVEIFTQVGATATTITASYTNQDGTASRTTVAVAFGGTGSREAQRIIWLPLADGDTGVRSVETVTVLATTGTAGNFGVFIAHPLVQTGLGSDGAALIDLLTGIPESVEVVTDAALALAFMSPGTTIPQGQFNFNIVEN